MAFKLEAQIGADGRGFFNTMNQVQGRTKTFASSLAGLKGMIGGVFGAYAIQGMARGIMDFADSITDMSKRLGVSAEWLQRFAYAAATMGGTTDDVAKALENLNKAREEIYRNSPEGKEFLAAGQRLGIRPQDWALRSEDIIALIAKAVRAGDVQALTTDLNDLLGRPFRNIVHMFKEDLEETMARAVVISDETREAIDRTYDAIQGQLQQMKVILATPLSSVLSVTVKAIGFLVAALKSLGTTISYIASNVWAVWKNIIRGDVKGANIAFADFWTRAMSGDIAKESNRTFKKAMRDWAKAFGLGPYAPPPSPPMIPQPFGRRFIEPTWAQKVAPEEPKRYGATSDDLIRVGNFLGAGGQAIGAIWAEQLRESRKQTQLQAEIAAWFRANRISPADLLRNSLGIPAL